jgi:hypothetical protein
MAPSKKRKERKRKEQKRKERKCENRVYKHKKKVGTGLGLAAVSAFEQWRRSPMAERWWAIFDKGFLHTDLYKTGYKGAEFASVYEHIQAGEASGAGRFSQPEADKRCANALDWQAWLLYNLVHHNTKYRDGCFYRKGSPKMDNYRAMWNAVKCELRDRGRRSKSSGSHKSPRGARKDTREKRSDTSSSEEEEELDPEVGIALVRWVNIPPDLMNAGHDWSLQILQFCAHVLTSFRAGVIKGFGLQDAKHEIILLETRDNINFHEAQRQASQGTIVMYFLETAETEIEEALEEYPPGIIKAGLQASG